MNQLTMFCDPPRARQRDPDTSHAAAVEAQALQARHHRIVLAALTRHGPAGKDRIGELTNLSGVQACRRLSELHRAGLIRPTGKTVMSTAGRQEREWETV